MLQDALKMLAFTSNTPTNRASERDLLMCEGGDSRRPGSNLLHTLCQFNTGPVYVDQVTTELGLYEDVAKQAIAVYKKHGALDWRGGAHDDTALAKACGAGNERMVRWMVTAGASAHPLGYSNIPHTSFCFEHI